MTKDPRIVFVTTNLFGEACLNALFKERLSVVGVLTLPSSSRVSVSDYADLSRVCRKFKVPLKTIRHINDSESTQILQAWKPDLLFIIGWSQLVDARVMAIPTQMTIGAHPSLLPKNRGRAAIPWHFINREKWGGLTLFKIDEGCDSGPIIAQTRFPIRLRDDATTYYETIKRVAARQLRKLASQIRKNQMSLRPQNHAKATILLRRRPEDGLIDWNQNSRQIHNLIRGTARPYPGAFTFWNNAKLILWKASPLPRTVRSSAPGEILEVRAKSLLVMTGDKPLRVQAWEWADGRTRLLVRGAQLGVSQLREAAAA